MAHAYKCDRCDKYSDRLGNHIELRSPVFENNRKRGETAALDLCEPCWQELQTWIEHPSV